MPEGLYVAAVSEGSDAEKQGIRVGDVITAVEGQNVTTTEEVVAIKDAHAVGDRLTFSIWRPEETLEITITLMDTNDIYG
jgi:serine protease Do